MHILTHVGFIHAARAVPSAYTHTTTLRLVVLGLKVLHLVHPQCHPQIRAQFFHFVYILFYIDLFCH